MKNTNFIYEYWGRTEFGKAMIASNQVSEEDLIFLMPNNVKRMHGIPVTRIMAKKKSKYKNIQRRLILSFKLFEVVEEVISGMFPEKIDSFFERFVEIQNFAPR